MKKIYSYAAMLLLGMGGMPAAATTNNVKDKIEQNDTLTRFILPAVDVYGKMNSQAGVQAFNAAQLAVMQAPTLGETLSRIPGVQNFSFGPSIGLPQIRSLSGSRVKLLSDGMALSDLSGITPNINIDIDQDKLTALDIYKHSATVLYGGKAIGGAVNMKTNLIPARIQGKDVSATATIDLGSNSGSRSSFTVSGNSGKHLSWHLGAMYHHNKEVRIPGNTKPALAYDTLEIGFNTILQGLAQMDVVSEHKTNYSIYPYISEFAKKYMEAYELSYGDLFTFDEESTISGKKVKNQPNPDYVPGQDPIKDRYVDVVTSIKDFGPVEKGKMPNSHSRGTAFEAGLNYTSRYFNIGAGYQHNHSVYGIPGYALSEVLFATHTHSDGTVHKAPKAQYVPINTRNDVHMGRMQAEVIDLVPFFPYVKLQGLFQRSADQELLADKVANEFNTMRQGARLELHQKRWTVLSGVTGIDYEHRKMMGEGSQRYLPNTRSNEWGFFTSQQLDYKFMHAHIGYRHDQIRRSVIPDSTYKTGRGLAGGKLSDKHFALHQFSATLRGDLWNIGYLSATYNHSERAPEVNELYAGNNHFAILTEENGNDIMDKETANTVELEAGAHWKGLRFSFTYYNTYFNDFLYLASTGISRNGFNVKEWRAADTKIYGFETQLAYAMDLQSFGTWEISTYYDLVKNKDMSGNEYRLFHHGVYMPNMPTSRFGGGLLGQWRQFSLNFDVDHYKAQKYLAKNLNPEHPFPAYTMLNARVSYQLQLPSVGLEFYMYGKNLLNEDCRPHNSPLRYLAPLPGINIGGGIKVTI